jgi:hypothetical protein
MKKLLSASIAVLPLLMTPQTAPAERTLCGYEQEGGPYQCTTIYDGPDAAGRPYICPASEEEIHIDNVHALSDHNRFIISIDYLLPRHRKRFLKNARMPIIHFDTKTQTLTVNGKRCRLHCTPDMVCE